MSLPSSHSHGWCVSGVLVSAQETIVRLGSGERAVRAAPIYAPAHQPRSQVCGIQSDLVVWVR